MKNTIKSIATLLVVTVMIVFVAGQVKAEYLAANVETGYESENTVKAESVSEHLMVNGNHEMLSNEADVEGETGDNDSDYNTGKGLVDGGDVVIVGGFTSEVNVNMTEQASTELHDFTAMNDTTGAYSDNDALASLFTAVFGANENLAFVANKAKIEGESGDNETSYNTGDGEVKSGDAEIDASVMNTVNGNLLIIGNDIDEESESLLESNSSNSNTGANSKNKAKVRINHMATAENINMAMLMNYLKTEAETGDNESSYNTGSAKIDTGDANTKTTVKNDVNYNQTMINMDLGDSNLEASNDTTGYESDNKAKVELNSVVGVMNANQAMVMNKVKNEAETGDNEASYNTGSATIKSGDADSQVSIDNGDTLNKNETEVNIDLGNISMTASNATTGANSTNKAKAEFGSAVAVGNTNGLMLSNDVKSEAETGDNEASYNTGTGNITSGDATSNVTVKNDANYNSTTVNVAPTANVQATNDTTGANSTNKAEASSASVVSVANQNCGVISNEVKSESNTGGNSTSYNTGAGTVKSGDASISFGVNNTTNGNSTTIGN